MPGYRRVYLPVYGTHPIVLLKQFFSSYRSRDVRKTRGFRYLMKDGWKIGNGWLRISRKSRAGADRQKSLDQDSPSAQSDRMRHPEMAVVTGPFSYLGGYVTRRVQSAQIRVFVSSQERSLPDVEATVQLESVE